MIRLACTPDGRQWFLIKAAQLALFDLGTQTHPERRARRATTRHTAHGGIVPVAATTATVHVAPVETPPPHVQPPAPMPEPEPPPAPAVVAPPVRQATKDDPIPGLPPREDMISAKTLGGLSWDGNVGTARFAGDWTLTFTLDRGNGDVGPRYSTRLVHGGIMYDPPAGEMAESHYFPMSVPARATLDEMRAHIEANLKAGGLVATAFGSLANRAYKQKRDASPPPAPAPEPPPPLAPRAPKADKELIDNPDPKNPEHRRIMADVIYRYTHRDYKGRGPDGSKTIMGGPRNGYRLIDPMDLPDDQMLEKYQGALHRKVRDAAEKAAKEKIKQLVAEADARLAAEKEAQAAMAPPPAPPAAAQEPEAGPGDTVVRSGPADAPMTATFVPGEGLILNGTSKRDIDKLRPVMVRHSLRWSGQLGAWFKPNSRDWTAADPRAKGVHTLAADLTAAGLPTNAEQETASNTAAEREASIVERAEARADRYEERAEKHQQAAAGHFARVDQIASGIPLGQPILVGHHSERHARRDAERIDSGMRHGIEEQKAAQYAAGRVHTSERTAAEHSYDVKNRGKVVRRIEKLEAEDRALQRQIKGRVELDSGGYGGLVARRIEPSADVIAQKEARRKEIAEEIAYHDERLKAAGYDRHAKAQEVKAELKPGDKVHTKLGQGTVIRVNPKSVTVDHAGLGSGHPWHIKHDHADVRKIED